MSSSSKRDRTTSSSARSSRLGGHNNNNNNNYISSGGSVGSASSGSTRSSTSSSARGGRMTLQSSSSSGPAQPAGAYHSPPQSVSGGSSVAGSSISTALSVNTSTYRHHHSPHAGTAFLGASPPLMTPGPHTTTTTNTTPYSPTRPILGKDASHQPKTRGSLGILIVGLGGNNGTTLAAGICANRRKQKWRGPLGQMRQANYNGCITQMEQRPGVTAVGYRGRIPGLADASMAAIGGWDIRPTKLGDALLEAQILDYDLVRQLQDELNKIKIFRGYYDERFIIGPSSSSQQQQQHTHVLSEREASTTSEALKCLRADIRYFKWRNGVVGHTTVVWSASSSNVEPSSSDAIEYIAELETARDLLDAMDRTEEERGYALPPFLLYATAALLEGCSFVNGGDGCSVQNNNTLASCPGLLDLARQQLGVYCLGTGFKAGQTRFKTAAMEYLRTMGLIPKVIASSNHYLGNNNNDDMRILENSSPPSKTKLHVKQDIFAPWQEEELEHHHQGSIMSFTHPNDEKRDYVEYTSEAFLGQTHTMMTYTRASDTVLCVPLLIDAAVWCDFFSSRSWEYNKVAKALAYLFQVPECAAEGGMDPGFFAQMQELLQQALAAKEASTKGKHHQGEGGEKKKKRVRIRPEKKTTEWAIPNNANIICAGLACVDMQLNQATGGDGGESIETFEGEKSIGGGSVSMACKTLARLTHGAPLNNGYYMTVTPPVVNAVIPLCKIGNDDTGNKLVNLLESCGEECRNVETKHILAARKRDVGARTALAVLPIYKDGRRGCFFDAASNATFSPREMTELIHGLCKLPDPSLDTSHMSLEDIEDYHDRMEDATPAYGAFLFGYPHLLPQLQGDALARILAEARNTMLEGGIIALDLNGVPEPPSSDHPVAPIGGGERLRKLPDLKSDPVIGSALQHVDILHMNEEELQLLTGCRLRNTEDMKLEDEFAIASAANLFLLCGVAIVVVTRGKKGSYVCCNDEDRFQRSPMLPPSWVDCTAKLPCVELPSDAVINTNGAGDSFTAGFLIAAMLRHTGMTVPLSSPRAGSDTTPRTSTTDSSFDSASTPPRRTTTSSASSSSTKPRKKLTPYQLYMRENYVALKQKCNDDKKKIFSVCHQMWEEESEDVKAFYERQAEEEEEQSSTTTEASQALQDQLDVLDSTPRRADHRSSFWADDDPSRNMYMTNRALNLESAVQFASLIAAHHVDTATRDMTHLDATRLLERALTLPEGLEEI